MSAMSIEFFAVSTKMTDLTFRSVLHTSTDASILSCVKILNYAKDLIPDNYLELHKI